MEIHETLRPILKKYALDYELVPSDVISDNPGNIFILKDYYPNNKESKNFSIALSYSGDAFDRKCWLSTDIKNTSDETKPKSNAGYSIFTHRDIKYYPYSINTENYSLTDIISLCDGLYQFAQME